VGLDQQDYLNINQKNKKGAPMIRKEKLAELDKLINLYRTVSQSSVQIEPVNEGFIKIGTANYTLASGKVLLDRKEIIKRDGLSSASIILPITETGEVVLIVQPRPLTKTGVGVELPAGYKDLLPDNKSVEEGKITALRELSEETGYQAKEIIPLGGYYQDQGCSRAYNECFLALDCVYKGTEDFDEDEQISKFLCSFDEVLELVEQGYINDGGSIITIERAKNILLKNN